MSGYPRDALYEAIHEGRLPAIRRGKRILVVMRELATFVEREAEGGDAMLNDSPRNDKDPGRGDGSGS